MKKILFFGVIAVAAVLVACGGSAKEDPFVTYNGVTSYSGTFYKTFDFDKTEKDSIVYDVKVEGEKAIVTIPVTFVRSSEALPEGELDHVTIVVRGRDDYKDFELRTDAEPAEVEKLKSILAKPAGEKVVINFKKELLKQDLDQIKGKKVWTSMLIG